MAIKKLLFPLSGLAARYYCYNSNSFIAKLRRVTAFRLTLAYILVLFLTLVTSSESQARNLLNNCMLASDLGKAAGSATSLKIRTLGTSCYKTCQQSCAQAYGLKIRDHDNNKIIEVNQDQIENCLINCQAGVDYAGVIRVFDKNSPNPSPWSSVGPLQRIDPKTGQVIDGIGGPLCPSSIPDPTGAISPESAAYAFFNSKSTVQANYSVTVAIDNTEASDQNIVDAIANNTVYLCGYSTVYLVPSVYSISSTDPVWNSMSPGLQGPLLNNWNARNASWTDTQTNIKNGDYLEITYVGRYRWQVSSDGSSIPNGFDDAIEIKTPTINNSWQDWLSGNPLSADANIILNPEIQNGKPFLGLWNKKMLVDYPSIFKQSFTNDNSPIFKHGYQGIIANYSERYARLGVRHYDDGKNGASSWNDNLGGYFAKISWKGCRYKDGERLQYAILPTAIASDASAASTYLNNDASWVNLPAFDPLEKTSVISAASINAYLSSSTFVRQADGVANGSLYFRIKMLTPSEMARYIPNSCSVSDSRCQSIFNTFSNPQTYARYNTLGSYDITVNVTPPDTDCGTVTKIVNDIRNTLFADKDTEKEGLIISMIHRIFKNEIIVSTLQIILTMNISYLGLSFIFGLGKNTSRELILKVFKISIVLFLISNDGWSAFYQYIVKMFLNASDSLMGIFIYTDADAYSFCPGKNSVNLAIDNFGFTFQQIFENSAIIERLKALLLSGFLNGFVGIHLAILLIVALVVYSLTIIKAILIYLLSLIGIGILMMISPIFIAFILFNYTKQFFDAWFKQLLFFILQPVFVFATISLVQQLFLLVVYAAFDFTICPSCALSVFGNCLINGYIIPSMSYTPGIGSVFIGEAMSFFAILIVVHAMHNLFDFALSLTGQLITYTGMGAEGHGLGNFASPVTALGKATGNAMGGALGLLKGDK